MKLANSVSNAPDKFSQLLANKKILLVDDNEDQLYLVKAYLNNTDSQLEWISNCEGALLKIQEQQYDLLILDVMMPDGDGWELFSKVRNVTAYKETPVLFFTCIISEELEVEATDEAGKCRTLSKPASRETFCSAIQQLLSD